MRAPQVVLHVDPVHRLVGHRRLEQGVPARWVALGPDHRDLRLAEHLARRRPPGRPRAIPSDALMNHSRPPIGNGVRSSLPIRSAIRRASSASRTGSRMIPNSSPPKRATVSLGRSEPTRRWPTAASSRSPTAWPTLSLMTLNRSRSSRITATDRAIGRRRRPARGRSGRSSSSRFGSPVVGSWSAPRWAASNRRELSSAIEASWANRTRAWVSRGPNARSIVPEASPMTPTVLPPDASGTPITEPNAPLGMLGRASGERRRSRRPRAAPRSGRSARRGPRRSTSAGR